MGLAPVLTVLWLANHLADDGKTPIGTVALSEPQCNVIVIISRGAFSVLTEQSHLYVSEGDTIQGDFNELGVHSFEVTGVMPVQMEVNATGVSLTQATGLFHRTCDRNH